MVKRKTEDPSKTVRTCNFLSGAFAYGGMTGVKSNTRDHPWVTRYLTAYLSRYTDGLYAGVGLILNTDHDLHRDVHNQKGVDNLVLPVVTSGGGLWIQDDPRCPGSSDDGSMPNTKETPQGRAVVGKPYTYQAHKVIKFRPDLWHESIEASGQQLLLIGYTPRSLHKLQSADRQLLWETGFTLLPACKDEFWGYSQREQILTRYHPVPRRQMFAPSSREWLPVDSRYLGDVRYCVQRFANGAPVRSTHMWKSGRGRASKHAWTGSSSFKLCVPDSRIDIGGGVQLV